MGSWLLHWEMGLRLRAPGALGSSLPTPTGTVAAAEGTQVGHKWHPL